MSRVAFVQLPEKVLNSVEKGARDSQTNDYDVVEAYDRLVKSLSVQGWALCAFYRKGYLSSAVEVLERLQQINAPLALRGADKKSKVVQHSRHRFRS